MSAGSSAPGKSPNGEAHVHPRRHLLQKALGGSNQFVDPQVGAVACEPGDMFLLCTDGLTDGLFDEQLFDLLRRPDQTEAAPLPPSAWSSPPSPAPAATIRPQSSLRCCKKWRTTQELLPRLLHELDEPFRLLLQPLHDLRRFQPILFVEMAVYPRNIDRPG